MAAYLPKSFQSFLAVSLAVSEALGAAPVEVDVEVVFFLGDEV